MALPRELVFRIISFMDIDTRRSLNIYTKLNVPDPLKQRIMSCFRKINTSDHDEYREDEPVADEGEYITSSKSYFISLDINGKTSQNIPMNCCYVIVHTFCPRGVMYEIHHHRRVKSKYTHAQILDSMLSVMNGGPNLTEDDHDRSENEVNQYTFGYEDGGLRNPDWTEWQVAKYNEIPEYSPTEYALYLDYLFKP